MDMNAVLQWFTALPDWVFNTIVSVAVVLAILLLKRILIVFFRPSEEDLKFRFVMENTFSIASTIAILIAMVLIWLQGFKPLLTVLGLIAAGLTISSKEIVISFFGFFALLTRDHFGIGDRICVAGDIWGDVTGKGMLFFTLLEVSQKERGQSTGRLIRVPNMVIFTHPVVNATKGFDAVWHEISLHVTPNSDWRALKTLMRDAAETWLEHSRLDLDKLERKMERSQVTFKVRRPGVYVSAGNGTINVTVRYLCPVRQRRDSEHAITEQILAGIEDKDTIHLSVEY
ncbi:MAG: mechanosensitive ion channel family protein [Oceanidesulfovibrio sp.]